MARRRTPLKDHMFETRLFFNRVLWMILLVVVLTAITITRLVYLQVVDHHHYSTLSNDNRVKLIAVPPTRGLIYDRNGVLLADNRPDYRIEITPEQVDDMEALVADLGRLVEVSEDDLKRFRLHLRRKHTFESIPLRFHLSDEEVARLAVVRHRLPGVNIVARLNRYYPFGDSLAHVIGYVGRIDERDLERVDVTDYRGTTHTGKIGIERYYESDLHGHVGYQQVETNAQGRVLRTLEQEPPVPGKHIYLSIDVQLQQAAEKALGEYSGAVVAMDPRNGEVLALVSKPGYDPNAFVNGISSTAYRALQANIDQPLFNRALLGQYPPGSTVKPFMGLAGLHYGTASPQRTEFCPGFYQLPGEERKFRDWKRTGHGRVALDAAIVESCDVYFYDLAHDLGIDRIHDFLKPFGFGSQTNIDMNGERPGLLPSREWKRERRGQVWFPGETLNTGIGQGYMLTTPLQLASTTATLAERGVRYQPRMLRATKDLTTGTVRTAEPVLQPKVDDVAEVHWDYVLESMHQVVYGKRGTAWRLRELPYQIAGKTGTAQVFGLRQDQEYNEEEIAKRLHDHALFIAFAPSDQPRIALAVVVENGGSGGSVGAPVAGEILQYFFEHLPQQAQR